MTKSNAALKKAQELANKVAKQATDMRVADAGSGYQPPAAGFVRMRLVGYVEVGDQAESYLGAVRIKPKVVLHFELSGKNHEPIKLEDGTVFPRRMKIELTQSNSERANLYKLFQQMNYDGDASHISQLIGKPYVGRIYHHNFTDGKGQKRTIARLKPEGGAYTIAPPFYEDGETGEEREYKVDPMLSEPLLFFWDFPDMDQWDSLFIEGEYEEGRSRNVIQERIRQATNWEESPMYALLSESDREESEYEPIESKFDLEEESAPAEEEKPKPAKATKVAKKAVKKAAPVVEEEEEEEEEAVEEEEDEEEEEEVVRRPAKSKATQDKPVSSRTSRVQALLRGEV